MGGETEQQPRIYKPGWERRQLELRAIVERDDEELLTIAQENMADLFRSAGKLVLTHFARYDPEELNQLYVNAQLWVTEPYAQSIAQDARQRLAAIEGVKQDSGAVTWQVSTPARIVTQRSIIARQHAAIAREKERARKSR